MNRPLHPWPASSIGIVLAVLGVLSLPSPAPLPAQETGSGNAAERADVAPPKAPVVPDELAAAADAAAAWLGFIDEGAFDQAWAAASSTLQVRMSPQLLSASIEPGRRNLGDVVDHTLLGLRVVTDPPNAQPGDYAIFQYRTRDEEGRTLIENVVLRPGGDGWLVAGYFTTRD